VDIVYDKKTPPIHAYNPPEYYVSFPSIRDSIVGGRLLAAVHKLTNKLLGAFTGVYGKIDNDLEVSKNVSYGLEADDRET
jgi:hypothetical protein